MLVVRNRIDRSPINGFGVFAEERILAKSLVWEFTPGVDFELEIGSLPALAQEFLRHYGNEVEVEGGIYLLCGDHARFMNHSDNPNISATGPRGYALRDIAAGEEITCNYKEFDIKFAGFLRAGTST